ncbi:pectinesterase family protein [Spirochaeta cellobiosiphila]|uniref:pectinesterase family protein n=1 Tax=Spirochaeta cellobiosiphila TaxID=504483 RepID=UPI0003FFE65E|nr:pectinesterase family protein [Spirochaeta cellobiosiphila]
MLNLYPEPQSNNVNPDAHLKVESDRELVLGQRGHIIIKDTETNTIIDRLDISLPPGPKVGRNNPEADYLKTSYDYRRKHQASNKDTEPGTSSAKNAGGDKEYQLSIIGGFTDGFHFHPVIIKGKTAIITLHHNLLEYNKTYEVSIEASILGFEEEGDISWTFTTKKDFPDLTKGRLIVDGSGQGDFDTLQGALDFIPDEHPQEVNIEIKKAEYDEIVYFRNKANINIKGEEREKTIIQYANNEVFNPHPWMVKTNEKKGTFPSRRATFSVDHCHHIHIENLTIQTLLKGQAEALLLNGEHITVKNCTIIGSGDALQANGSVYMENIHLEGDGDTILTRGATFIKDSHIISTGPFIWPRNPKDNHGNVFVNCRFTARRKEYAVIARAPYNKKPVSYPYAEVVLLNCTLDQIDPKGWGIFDGETSHVHLWEYKSKDPQGNLIDTSERMHYSRQLDEGKDKELIEKYSNPEFVLGWE